MSLDERITEALVNTGLPVAAGTELRSAPAYYTFNYDLLPVRFADDVPWFYKALIQVHLFCPLRYDSAKQRKKTLKALVMAGFGWPEVIDASERDSQHLVFECEAMIERTEFYGS